MTDERKIRAAIKALKVREVESIVGSVESILDRSTEEARAIVTKETTALQGRLDQFLARITFDRFGNADPTNPQNVLLLNALKTDLEAYSATMAAGINSSMAMGLGKAIKASAKLWVDSAKPAMVVRQGMAVGVGKIKGISDKAARDVFDAFNNSLMTGTVKRADLAERIGEIVGRSEGQAAQLVHDISFGGYRQANLAAGNEAGADLYMMTGAMDDRITQICFRHLGQIKTRAEWLAINANVFLWGLHHRCRHAWIAVDKRTYAKLNKSGAIEGERLLYSNDARRQIKTIEEEYGGDVRAWFKATRRADSNGRTAS